MANHKSAAKRARQSVKRKNHNLGIKSATRTIEKRLRLAISDKKVDDAKKLLVDFSSSIDKATQKGIYHANKAARSVSRLSKQE